MYVPCSIQPKTHTHACARELTWTDAENSHRVWPQSRCLELQRAECLAQSSLGGWEGKCNAFIGLK